MLAENKSLRQGFRRSRELARPGMKRIVLTLGSLELVGTILAVVITALLAGDSWEQPTALGFLAGWLLAVALLPFRAALMTLLYLERRVRREGYDLELALAESSGAA
jgi:hypothetical protein